MIIKFKTIKNLALFQDFCWDSSVRDAGGNVQSFKNINIIYGRNYSGKTTLSRIVRALEEGVISDKYENPKFEVSINNLADATQDNLTAHRKIIRVFNQDFVKNNLRFIVNTDDGINPFAILGGNISIENEIATLKAELGINDQGKETGFYFELKNATESSEKETSAYKKAESKLKDQLDRKATNNPDGIKYKSERFGDQNYNINKLRIDINTVQRPSFIPLTDDEVIQKLALLKETVNQDVKSISKVNLNIQTISNKAEILTTKSISSSNKIEQLLKSSILNKWVKEGRQLHKDKLVQCSFCNNHINSERWKELDSHFDEESEKLEKEIDILITEIKLQIEVLDSCLNINKSVFYSKYHTNLERLDKVKQFVIKNIKSELTKITKLLEERKADLLNPKIYPPIADNSRRLEWCWNIFENIRIKANSYSTSLEKDKTSAKELLRFREVSDFIKTIQYSVEVEKINELETAAGTKLVEKTSIDTKIKEQIQQIDDKKRLMNDEEKGALKVNEYLNNFFGHDFLKLQALEEYDQFGSKKIRFEIIRNSKKAHHLSEGECSLIAFCYFMAKLEDIETKDRKPIIWIDDPISSLDSNHIFFVYSLISYEIVTKESFEQLFISTHNLDFLKYLKRLPKINNTQRGYFLISRELEISHIKPMPKYLKEYVTEFNFLFHQVYLCANASTDEDTQHNVFYNFGNNTRKFLESFLFYRYPNAIEKDDKLKRFFGENNIAPKIIDRINNEFSHLEALFERSMTPIDIPEMKKVAQFILRKIEDRDKDQYDALLQSIGVVVKQE